MSLYDILLEALKRSGACGSDLLKKVDTGISYNQITKKQEFLILALIPFCVGILIIISAVLDRIGGTSAEIAQSVALLAVFLGGGNRFHRGVKDLFLNRKITVDVFVSVSLLATMLIGEFLSAAIVIFIMAVSGAVEAYTMDKSSRTIRGLLSLAPKVAYLIENDMEVEISIQDIRPGDTLLVRPGNRIPVDGIVLDGVGEVNESVITGEAMPVTKHSGDTVFAGTLNETGKLFIQASTEPEDTIFSQIAQMVNVAQERKAPIQKTVDRFTTWYLPIMLVAAVVGYILTRNVSVAVSILLVAAPCALAIGTPTAMSAAMANMTKKGVLIKGGDSFELGGKLNVLMMDKTGTLTTGIPSIQEIRLYGEESKESVLALAAAAERDSAHPFAKAICMEADQQGLTVYEPERFTSYTGMGVKAKVKGKQIIAGTLAWVRSQIENDDPSFPECDSSHVAVTVDGSLVGILSFVDTLRSSAAAAIQDLQELLGQDNVILLSGDQQTTAENIAKACGIQCSFGNLKPIEKEQMVRQAHDQGRCVAMVGDGINDGPALACADIGIAMGVSGTDFAAETADVVLMQEDLGLVAEFISLSRAVVRRIKLNIFFSIVFNVIGILLGGMGLLTPVLAIVLQEAGTMMVLLSSTLLRGYQTK